MVRRDAAAAPDYLGAGIAPALRGDGKVSRCDVNELPVRHGEFAGFGVGAGRALTSWRK